MIYANSLLRKVIERFDRNYKYIPSTRVRIRNIHIQIRFFTR